MATGTKVGNIFLDLNLNSKGFNTQLNGISKLAGKAALGIAAAFSVKEIVAFSKECINLGSDLAEVQNVVDVAFPTMSKQVDAFAAGAAKNFGLSETMAKRFSGTFGSMATAFGFAEGEAATMATTLTGLAGDIASFYNISQDEAYTKLKSVFTGETESLKDLGVVMTQTALDAYALEKGFGKTTKSMTEAEKVALRYSFVQNQLSNAAGDFIRTSDSWANQVRVLSLQFDTLRAAIGEGFINVLKPAVKWLNAIMEKLIVAAKAFAAFTAAFTKGDSAAESMKAASASADKLGGSTAATADNLSSANGAAKELKRTLAGFDQITKVEEENSAATGGNAALGGLSIADGITEATASVEKETSNMWKTIGGFFSDVVGSVFKPWMDNAEKIRDVFSKIKKIFSEIFGKIFKKDYEDSFIHKFFEGFTDAQTNRLSNNLDKLSAGLDVILDLLEGEITLSDAMDTIFGIITGVKPSQVKLSVITTFKALRETTFNNAKKIYDEIQDKVVKFEAEINQTWNDLKGRWHSIVDNIQNKKAELKAEINQKWSDLQSKWHSIVDNIQDKKVKAKMEIGTKWEDLKSEWENLRGKFKDKTVEISLKFSAAASDLKEWINKNVINKINGAFDKVPILKNVNIPLLAQGGFVKANTPQLAVIGDNRHQGEVVSPEDKLIEMAKRAAELAGGSRDTEIVTLLRQILAALAGMNLTATVDVVALKKLIVRLINEHTQSTGVCEILV